MIRLGPSRRAHALFLKEESPLRRVDPRVKLALSLGASLAVMLPLYYEMRGWGPDGVPAQERLVRLGIG